MDNDIAIKVENVSKKYCKTLKRSMLYGIKDIGRNTFGLSSQPDRLRKNEFWAIDDVSFELKKGETLGIIGPNGSGKTTLLKMLNGIFWPNKGRITIKGRVGALIAVGAGFHPLFTGRENIYINGAILGMTKREIDEKFDSIVEFADIGDFLDTPVKFYSSGMFVRLGFAIAVHCEPDILLVDEVLAVGDVEFQRKCFQKMKSLLETGTSVVLISHSTPSVLSFCKTGLVLNKGGKIGYGDIFSVMQIYNDFLDIAKRRKIDSQITGEKTSHKIIVDKITFFDLSGNEFKNNEIPLFSDFSIVVKYHTDLRIHKPLVWGNILKENEVISIFGGHFSDKKNQLPDILPHKGTIRFIIKSQNLTPSTYIFRLGVRSKDAYFYEDLINSSVTFRIIDNKKIEGFLYNKNFSVFLNNKIEVFE